MADYIPHDAARPDIFCAGISCDECPFLIDPIKGGCKVDEYISSLPAANVAPIVHAHWTLVAETPHFCIDECSACHGRTIDARAYCTNCGAKMDESEDEDNA